MIGKAGKGRDKIENFIQLDLVTTRDLNCERLDSSWPDLVIFKVKTAGIDKENRTTQRIISGFAGKR